MTETLTELCFCDPPATSVILYFISITPWENLSQYKFSCKALSTKDENLLHVVTIQPDI